MKRKIIASLMSMMLLIQPISAIACERCPNDAYECPRIMRTTCYDPLSCEGTITATGKHVRFGICGTSKAHLGQTALVWLIDENGEIGEFLGYFECEDTGSKVGENRIDIWQSSREDSLEWIKLTQDYVYVQFVDAEG